MQTDITKFNKIKDGGTLLKLPLPPPNTRPTFCSSMLPTPYLPSVRNLGHEHLYNELQLNWGGREGRCYHVQVQLIRHSKGMSK